MISEIDSIIYILTKKLSSEPGNDAALRTYTRIPKKISPLHFNQR
jgi:hypothetical protein